MVRDSIYTWEVADDASQKAGADLSMLATKTRNVHTPCGRRFTLTYLQSRSFEVDPKFPPERAPSGATPFVLIWNEDHLNEGSSSSEETVSAVS